MNKIIIPNTTIIIIIICIISRLGMRDGSGDGGR
jgi:hypothetical protein